MHISSYKYWYIPGRVSFADLDDIREFLLLALVSAYRARVVFIGSSSKLHVSVHVAILTTPHAQLTRGHQEALIF